MSSTFVKIENGVVTQSIVSEVSFIKSGALGDPSLWTENDPTDMKKFGGIGYTYNEDLGFFIPPKPYNSWIFNSTTHEWEAPVAKPNDGHKYFWFEEIKQWMRDTTSETLEQLLSANNANINTVINSLLGESINVLGNPWVDTNVS